MHVLARGHARRAGLGLVALLLAGWYCLDARRVAPAPSPGPFPPRPDAPGAKAAPAARAEPLASPPSYQDFLDALTHEFAFGRERQAVLREMLEGAPPDAVEGLLRLSFGTEALNDISHVLIERLATLAPEAALAFAREKRFGLEPPWWHSVLGGLADPRLPLGDLLALPESDARTRYVGHLAFLLGSGDAEAGMRFALSSAPPETRETAVANVIFAAARRDPADGFELALLYGPATGDAALARRIAVDWALTDYAAAEERILGLAEGETRQSALAGLAAAAISRDPATAPRVIARLRDAETRQALLVDAARQLYASDPTAAARWVEASTELSAANKAALRDFAARATR